MVTDQLHILDIPDRREKRFQGKVSEAIALCRGGEYALRDRGTPWFDWPRYWGTGDLASLPCEFISIKLPANRGVAGAIEDLEILRVGLIKFKRRRISERNDVPWNTS
jgi:hypothetical protein